MRALPAWLTPDSALAATLLLVGACALAAPIAVQSLLKDGGFSERRQSIDLSNWTHISAFRKGGAYLGINREVDGTPHHESWINAGQWLQFDRVPVARHSVFIAQARVHPQWPRDSLVPVEFVVEATSSDGRVLRSVVEQLPAEQDDWAQLRLPLADLAGSEVSIRISPRSQQDVWTLLRDPAATME